MSELNLTRRILNKMYEGHAVVTIDTSYMATSVRMCVFQDCEGRNASEFLSFLSAIF
jgi:hypothetical protein